MKNVGKKLGSLFLAFAIMLTAVVCDVTPVQAASSTTYAKTVATESGLATMGTEYKVPFTLNSNHGMRLTILVPAPVSVGVTVYNAYGKAVSYSQTIPDSLFEFVQIDEENSAYAAYEEFSIAFPSGDYSYGLTFSQDTLFILLIHQYNTASIQSKATITAGFTKKLSVSGAKVKKWESRNKAIAAIDKNGKVTAKKKGKTKIIATLEDGETKLECTVTVVANKYSATKHNVDDAKKGSSAIVPYAASFDSKGNIVIKAQVINNASYRLGQIKNLKFVVEDENGKVVGTYKAATTNVNVPSQSTKDYTFIIKKADLKKKKVDLRNSLVTVKIKNADKAAVYYR